MGQPTRVVDLVESMMNRFMADPELSPAVSGPWFGGFPDEYTKLKPTSIFYITTGKGFPQLDAKLWECGSFSLAFSICGDTRAGIVCYHDRLHANIEAEPKLLFDNGDYCHLYLNAASIREATNRWAAHAWSGFRITHEPSDPWYLECERKASKRRRVEETWRTGHAQEL